MGQCVAAVNPRRSGFHHSSYAKEEKGSLHTPSPLRSDQSQGSNGESSPFEEFPKPKSENRPEIPEVNSDNDDAVEMALDDIPVPVFHGHPEEDVEEFSALFRLKLSKVTKAIEAPKDKLLVSLVVLKQHLGDNALNLTQEGNASKAEFERNIAQLRAIAASVGIACSTDWMRQGSKKEVPV
ncbi:hypothetical protein NA57DRAFT_51459 [Rhizodiscina lignyota]|uniref:Uncharacterized protein n=1 Tax=Rhizodiscina lignyota TaxID=1504668 RepID=A0A9P4IUE9_9PEZI|nr:hypothetical protein NA57DRAFT_51459 [Rhizodiscina lignyota]